MRKLKVIAVDFDGTIVEHNFPEIGKMKENVVAKMRKWYEEGHTICIWTCRTDQYEQDARKYLADNNIPFHYFNENPTSSFGDGCRKILAHVYLDDRALNVDDLDSFNLETLEHEDDELMKDLRTLVCKINELSIQTVHPDLSEIKKIVSKYNL